MPEDYMKACLYDVTWQKLRVSLLAENSELGGFGTVAGVEDNLARLETYFRASQTTAEMARRAWRILNLLNATLLGYGFKIRDIRYVLVKAMQETYSKTHAGTWGMVRYEPAWDWNQVESELRLLHRQDEPTFNKIWCNLRKRVETANRKEKLGKGGMKYRSELQRFLDLMVKVSTEVDFE